MGITHTHGRASNNIKWEFEGSNSYVGIIVLAMDDDEFANFKNKKVYTYYILSNGKYYADSGDFDVPYSDTWYILFFNVDSDRQRTNLSYTVEFDPFPIETFFIIVIVIIIFGCVIGVVVKKNRARARTTTTQARERPEDQYPPQVQPPPQVPSPVIKPPLPQPAPPKPVEPEEFICTYCGERTTGDAAFCPSCGAKLNR